MARTFSTLRILRIGACKNCAIDKLHMMKAVHEQTQPESIESNESVSSSNEYAYRPLTMKHKRTGSTGTTGDTTGDEECTSDEDELYEEETNCTVVNTLHQIRPIHKSDLTCAATDLFGYINNKGDGEADQASSLSNETDMKFPAISSKNKISLYGYNDEMNNVLSIHFDKNKTILTKPLVISENSVENTVDNVENHPQCSCVSSDKQCQNSHFEENNEESVISNSEENECNHISRENFLSKELESKSEILSNCTTSLPTLQWGRAVAEVKEHAVSKLQEELKRAHEELKLKDKEVGRLSRIRQDVEAELEELTASLFQEAHNMVREANIRQANAERLLEESRMKAEVLAAEVAALKTLVLTSTPARPNPHLHPQIDTRSRGASLSLTGDENPQGLFTKKHRRSPSHFNLKYGRDNSPPNSPVREHRTSLPGESIEKDWRRDREKERESKDFALEVDPRVHLEFLNWKASPCLDKGEPFVERVFREDIDLCLDFPNKELGIKVRQAVLDGIIFIEAVSDKTKLAFPKKCALLETPRQCYYRMRLGDQDNQWYCISQICRNRIIAVCDFLNYLRYVERGLVKSSVHDIYWEITRLRKEMVFARLGLALSS